jgi:hypothetical protein
LAKAKHLLVVSPVKVDAAALGDEIRRRGGQQPAEVRIIAPAVTESRIRHALGDVDEAIVDAESRLQKSIEGLRGSGLRASGAIGDSDPLVAAEDALGTFPADEIVIVTHRGEAADWFERDLFDRAVERFEPPISHVELGNGHGGLAEVERSGAGVSGDEPGAEEVEISPNLPPFSKLDLAGIVIAIGGTVALAILAANPPGGADSFAGAARILIALAFALINLAHVVGLLLFNSQRYRGAGQTLFRTLSLIGTPVAIVVSLLLG